jgi:PhnB protein
MEITPSHRARAAALTGEHENRHRLRRVPPNRHGRKHFGSGRDPSPDSGADSRAFTGLFRLTHPRNRLGAETGATASADRLTAALDDEEMRMPTKLNPYISFKDNAREAMQFYQSVFGGNLTMSTFAEFQMAEDPAESEKIMHSQLDTDNGLTLMGADTPNSMEYDDGKRVTISLSGESESELRGYWDKLADGGTVTMPLEQAPWGDSFGMCTDRYGVDWMVNIAGSGNAAGSAGNGAPAS